MSAFIMRMIYNRPVGGKEDGSHQRHGACECGIFWCFRGNPLDQLLHLRIAVLTNDALLVMEIVESGNAHATDEGNHQSPMYQRWFDEGYILKVV